MAADPLRGKLTGSQDLSDDKSITEGHAEWEKAAELRALQFVKYLPQVALPEQDTPPVIFVDNFWQSQVVDPLIGEVLQLVELGKLTSRRVRRRLTSTVHYCALSRVHDLAGHQGQTRTLHLARQNIFLPQIERDINKYVK